MDEWAESWITKDEVFLPLATSFNDPYDCQANVCFEASREEVTAFLERRNCFQEISNVEKWRLIDQAVEDGRFTDKRATNGFFDTIQSTIYEYGILSLSANKDDILMFAHYSHSHTGYCLEFDSSMDDMFAGAENVKYSKKYPRPRYFIEDEVKIVRELMLTKAENWEYEEEWRVFKKGSGMLNYRKEALTGIILGCRMSDPDKDVIIKLNRTRKIPAQLYQARVKPSDYALDIQPLNP